MSVTIILDTDCCTNALSLKEGVDDPFCLISIRHTHAVKWKFNFLKLDFYSIWNGMKSGNTGDFAIQIEFYLLMVKS